MNGTCPVCVHFENEMCKLNCLCLNYDHFHPRIQISVSDFEERYVSRISYDALLSRAEAAEAKVERLRTFTQKIISVCKDPQYRTKHDLLQMCLFLNYVRGSAIEALKGGENEK